MKIAKASGLSGEVIIPGDKSISHRAVMFGALGEGLTEVTHFLQGADCLSTISCFRRMGIPIRNEGDRVLGGRQRASRPVRSFPDAGRGQQRDNHKTDFRHSGRTALFFHAGR